MQSRSALILGVLTATFLLCCGVTGVGGLWWFARTEGPIRITIGEEAPPLPVPSAPTIALTPVELVPSPTVGSESNLEPASPTVAPAPTSTPTLAPSPTVRPTQTKPTPASQSPTPPADVGPVEVALPDVDEAALRSALIPASWPVLAEQPGVPLYRIGAQLDPAARTITGEQAVRFTNTEPQPLTEVYFRLYPNADHYNEGEIVVSDVRVGGLPAEGTLEVDETALRVALPQPLASGQSVEVVLQFRTQVPRGGGYGIFAVQGDVFALYNWHPVLAVWENGGWLLNPVTEQGDPTNTDVANYQVRFVAPEGVTVVTGGQETVGAAEAGRVAHEIVAPLTRNLLLVASDRFEELSAQAGEVEVHSYFLSGDRAGGQEVLDVAVSSLELFAERFGPYPFTELDVTEVALGGGAAGMEATGLIMIGRDYYDPDADPLAGLGGLLGGVESVSVLAFTTAHEVAHQWWYGVVGSDAYLQPWLDESLTNWSAAFWVDETAGEEAGLIARDLFITLSYYMVLGDGDVRLDQPVDRFDEAEYGGIVYGKGALMYDVLREEIGNDALFRFLGDYYAANSFARTDSDDWRAALAAVIGVEQTTVFYEKWVTGDDITSEDLPPGGPLTDIFGGLDLGMLGGLLEELE